MSKSKKPPVMTYEWRPVSKDTLPKTSKQKFEHFATEVLILKDRLKLVEGMYLMMAQHIRGEMKKNQRRRKATK